MIDITDLTQPIAASTPAGTDLRASGDNQYILLKDYRLSASQQERDALYDENAPRDFQYWRKIVELAPTLLKERSKDISIAAWLTEALIRLEGFSGLAQGLNLLSQLIINFWPDIYPQEDDDGLITKVVPLISLNGQQGEGTLIAPIYSIPLATNQDKEIAGWQYH